MLASSSSALICFLHFLRMSEIRKLTLKCMQIYFEGKYVLQLTSLCLAPADLRLVATFFFFFFFLSEFGSPEPRLSSELSVKYFRQSIIPAN